MKRNYTVIETNDKGERLMPKKEYLFSSDLAQRFIVFGIAASTVIVVYGVVSY